MKTFISAIALVIAAPAAAQATADPSPHAGHGQHGEHRDPEGAGHHYGHKGHGQHEMDCCDKDEQQGDKKTGCPAHRESGEAEQEHSAHGH